MTRRSLAPLTLVVLSVAAACWTLVRLEASSTAAEPASGSATQDETDAAHAELVERIFRDALSSKETYATLVDLTSKCPHRLSGSPAPPPRWSGHGRR